MSGVVKQTLDDLGGLGYLAWDSVRCSIRRPLGFRLLVEQLFQIGVMSLSITSIVALFTGLVISVQTAYSLSSYGGQLFIGDLVALSLVRELGPVLTSLMVAGRVGAGITAELGSMAVTEQVDALETLAYDPNAYLIVPRVIAGAVMFPIVVLMANTTGVLAGWGTSLFLLDMSTPEFVKGLRLFFEPWDVWFAVIKSVSFGLTVTSVGCFFGLHTTGGAQGVGRSTTQAVVLSSMIIVVLDAFWAAVLL